MGFGWFRGEGAVNMVASWWPMTSIIRGGRHHPADGRHKGSMQVDRQDQTRAQPATSEESLHLLLLVRNGLVLRVARVN